MIVNDVEEAEVWKRIKEITYHTASVALERDPDKQFTILQDECRRTFEQEAQRRKIDYDRSKRPDADRSVVEQCWKLWDVSESQKTRLNVIFVRDKKQILEWIRDIPYTSIHRVTCDLELNEGEASVWKRIQEIALTSPYVAVPLTKEVDPAKQLDLLKTECQRWFKQEVDDKKGDYDRTRGHDSFQLWELARSQNDMLPDFFRKYEVEIKKWMHDNVWPVKMRQADRKGIF